MDPEIEKVLSESYSKDVPIKFINYKGLFVPDSYSVIADSIENFEVRDDDVWVCSFPKTGTTWTQEMVWCIGNDLNFETTKIPLGQRSPFIEFTGTTTLGWIITNGKIQSKLKPNEKMPDYVTNSIEYAKNLPSPRFLKTHLPFHLLPRQLRNNEKKCKIICVVRNPKDSCISYYNHYKLLEAYVNTFENFCNLFLYDKVYYAPYWNHIIGYWQNKDSNNILLLRYEDMKANLMSEIKKTAAYLGKSFNSEQLKTLEEHLSFNSMKNNPALNLESYVKWMNSHNIFGEQFQGEGNFIRKGEVGQWKVTMTEELNKRFDEWTAEKLEDVPDKSLLYSFIHD